MTFKSEITWAHVLVVVAMVASTTVYAYSTDTRVTILEQRYIDIERIEKHLHQIHIKVDLISQQLEYQRGRAER